MAVNQRQPSSALQTAILTTIAMVAFAGNSIICRLALADGTIDAASFTGIRLLAGALTLVAVLSLRNGLTLGTESGSWPAALALFVYAACFSFAYVSLSTASGALVLFGAVQATMIVAAMLRKEKALPTEWFGWCIAAGGFVWMLLPGASTPSLQGALLMSMAGVGWGFYSLYGRAVPQPLAATTGNFVRVLLPMGAVTLVTVTGAELTTVGVLLAVLSGSLTTGLGYVIWYAALPRLTSLQAAVVQLSVPGIAALGGVVLISEALSQRLLLSGVAILGGICVALAGRYRHENG